MSGSCGYWFVQHKLSNEEKEQGATKDFDVQIQNIDCGLEGYACAKKLTVGLRGISIESVRGSAVKMGGAVLPGNTYTSRDFAVYPSSYWLVIKDKITGLTVFHDNGN